MADFDVDALCAELDDILQQPATGRSGAAAAAAKPRQPAAPNSSVLSSFPPSSSSSRPFGAAAAAAAVAPSHSSSAVRAQPKSAGLELKFDDSDDDGGSTHARRVPMPRAAAAASGTASGGAAAAARRTGGSGAGGQDIDDDLNSLLADMDSAMQAPAGSGRLGASARAVPASGRPASGMRSSAPTASSSSAFGAGADSASVSAFRSASSGASVPAVPAPSSGARSGGGVSGSRREKVKCFPVLLSSGASNAPRACSNLLCLSCEQPVVCVSGARWRSSAPVDYLFFRTHYPDTARMRDAGGVEVQRSPPASAYACACSWQSVGAGVGDEADSLNLSTLDRGDRAQREGCSSWSTLKWACMGH